jgi:hypothetical protein
LVVLVGGFTALGLLATMLPASMRVDALRNLEAADLCVMIAMITGFSASIIAGWCTAAVATGDRTHRAAGLAASLPISRMTNAAVRLISLLPGLAVPYLLTNGFEYIGLWLDPNIAYKGNTSFPDSLVIGLSVAGTVSVWCAATLTRSAKSMFLAQLIGHLATLVIAVLAYFIAWRTTFSIVSVPEDARRLLYAHDRLIEDLLALSALISTVAAASVAALSSLLIVALRDLRRWPQRRTRYATGAAVAATIATAIATPAIALRYADGPEGFAETLRDLQSSDDEIADAIARFMDACRRSQSPPPDAWHLWNIGIQRVALAAARGEAEHPLARTFREHESFDTLQAAVFSSTWQPSGDPGQERAWLEAIVAHPHVLLLSASNRWVIARSFRDRYGDRFSPSVESSGEALADALVVLQEERLKTDSSIAPTERSLRIRAIVALRQTWLTPSSADEESLGERPKR